ncbi:uncharacterized protein BDR25DRAFT_264253 [Lindgomyces ingoldianus]|uniref:Uncharacterized protein n=1 Tax=Lindgomyces ingoldianus TaxID=673940 RepID=A0ACB6QQE8_9PLEO|nr:uncharacterized protein BDR25DRAFT_264253 [Lindgomyces ingoldianus]KAF2469082.1 hypothetical protein BDR25DRAFT_264253 [Lindgomyces ingoldianus]
MASVLGLFIGGVVTAIPVVTGVAEGVSYQKQQNEEAANETRMIKFNMNVSCESDDELVDEVDQGIVVLRHDKVWIVPRDDNNKPIPPVDTIKPPLHAFAGFYIQYPDDDRFPAERGLVSTISDDPPMLNWIYVDRTTYELRYGNRSASIQHIVGEWDWTDDESAVTLDGWEGFVAVDEGDGEGTKWGGEGLRWAVYFDKDDNGLKGKRGKKPMLEVNLERKLQSEEEQLKQLEDANRKMQVKSQGDLKTQFTAPAADKKKKKVWGK